MNQSFKPTKFTIIVGAAVLTAGFAIFNNFKPVPTEMDQSILPISDAVVRVVGSGQHVLSVFEAPECAYCDQLAPGLASLQNVTLRRYVLPGQSESSRKTAIATVCAAQPGIAAADCAAGAATVDRNLALARGLGIPATPALIFANGDVHIGALKVDQLEAKVYKR